MGVSSKVSSRILVFYSDEPDLDKRSSGPLRQDCLENKQTVVTILGGFVGNVRAQPQDLFIKIATPFLF